MLDLSSLRSTPGFTLTHIQFTDADLSENLELLEHYQAILKLEPCFENVLQCLNEQPEQSTQLDSFIKEWWNKNVPELQSEPKRKEKWRNVSEELDHESDDAAEEVLCMWETQKTQQLSILVPPTSPQPWAHPSNSGQQQKCINNHNSQCECEEYQHEDDQHKDYQYQEYQQEGHYYDDHQHNFWYQEWGKPIDHCKGPQYYDGYYNIPYQYKDYRRDNPPDNIHTPLQPQQIQPIIRQADELSQYGHDRKDEWELSLVERDENQTEDNSTVVDLPETQEDGLEEGKDSNLSGEGEVEDTAQPP
ncbi:hypothetical protein C0995_013928 [Termitomyces sp. Mi166|nr:hypothetical protein C0995_013928 [Termitomyces sp. Mi166\